MLTQTHSVLEGAKASQSVAVSSFATTISCRLGHIHTYTNKFTTYTYTIHYTILYTI